MTGASVKNKNGAKPIDVMLLLECPRCHNRMKYQSASDGSDVSKKVKKCVYCNFSMSVGKSIVQKI